jgi:acyl carrier protein
VRLAASEGGKGGGVVAGLRNAKLIGHSCGRDLGASAAEQAMSVRLKIVAAMEQIAAEQRVVLPSLEDNLSLHETGFDSLAYAILVARLEDELGVDPFTMSADASFPLTIGDFIRAYENVPA